jgi:hypothetical protein
MDIAQTTGEQNINLTSKRVASMCTSMGLVRRSFEVSLMTKHEWNEMKKIKLSYLMLGVPMILAMSQQVGRLSL